MPTVRTAKHLLLESTTKSVESGTNDVICQFCTVKGMVVESEVLKAQNCALSKFSLPVHCNGKQNAQSKFLICSVNVFLAVPSSILGSEGTIKANAPGS